MHYVFFSLYFMAALSSWAADSHKLPLVYSPNYNLGSPGFIDVMLDTLKVHPFDFKKYAKIHAHLKEAFGLEDDNFITPESVSHADLLAVHDVDYLNTLENDALYISKGFDVGWGLALIGVKTLDDVFLSHLRHASGGTVKAVELALEKGWSINLGGGYHHAKPGSGEGGCFYADVPLAIKRARETKPGLKVLIVDTDAHQGNGNAAFAKNDPHLFIFDMYNKNEYPVYAWREYNPIYDGKEALKSVRFNFGLDGGYMGTTKFSQYFEISIPYFADFPLIGRCDTQIPRRVDDHEYLRLLENELPASLAALEREGNLPDLIVYNAGTDIFAEDELGWLDISAEGIIKRDLFVWKTAREAKIPIAMVLSGGYGPKNASIISHALEAIIRMEMAFLNVAASKTK